MEKLIELLDEYEIKRKKTKMNITDKRNEGDFDNEYTQLIIISKQFGFILWLLDNDKIEPLRKFIGWETDEDEPYIQFDLVDQYIAYLSIQDNPIEFLISILK